MEPIIKEQLVQIYKSLLTIPTMGKDSVTMVKCFQSLEILIKNCSNAEQEDEA